MATPSSDNPDSTHSEAPIRLRRCSCLALLLLLIVGLPSVWLVQGLRRASRQRNAIAEIKKAGGTVHYDYEFDKSWHRVENAEPPYPAWLLRILGVDFFCPVVQVNLRIIWAGEGSSPCVTDSTMLALQDLPQLEFANIGGRPEVNDEMLRRLTRSEHLTHLLLDRTGVTDEGLAHIGGLTELETLFLGECRVTDAGLTHMKPLVNLQELILNDTQISDAGLEHLAGLPKLERIHLCGTRVTPSGVSKLKESLPDIEIVGPMRVGEGGSNVD